MFSFCLLAWLCCFASLKWFDMAVSGSFVVCMYFLPFSLFFRYSSPLTALFVGIRFFYLLTHFVTVQRRRIFFSFLGYCEWKIQSLNTVFIFAYKKTLEVKELSIVRFLIDTMRTDESLCIESKMWYELSILQMIETHLVFVHLTKV